MGHYYRLFVQRYARYIEPIACTYAYCLLRNHFHLPVRTRTQEEQEALFETLKVFETFRVLSPSRQFSKLFSSYAKAFNKAYGRSGSLFERPFRRLEVEADTYFTQLVAYIHQNPQRHGLVADFRDWPFLSYEATRRVSRNP